MLYKEINWKSLYILIVIIWVGGGTFLFDQQADIISRIIAKLLLNLIFILL